MAAKVDSEVVSQIYFKTTSLKTKIPMCFNCVYDSVEKVRLPSYSHLNTNGERPWIGRK